MIVLSNNVVVIIATLGCTEVSYGTNSLCEC